MWEYGSLPQTGLVCRTLLVVQNQDMEMFAAMMLQTARHLLTPPAAPTSPHPLTCAWFFVLVRSGPWSSTTCA